MACFGMAVIQHMPGLNRFQVQAAYKLDSTCAEVEEMLAVCVYMGGGPALMYVGEAVKAWEAMVPAAG